MYQKKRNFGQNLDFWLFAQAWRATYECIHGNLFFCWAYQCMECKYLSRLSHRKFGLKYILDPTHSDRILVIIIIFFIYPPIRAQNDDIAQTLNRYISTTRWRKLLILTDYCSPLREEYRLTKIYLARSVRKNFIF